MYKNASYKEKYASLQHWLPSIIEIVKKDLKNEHLKKDFVFIKKYLPTSNIHKVTVEELAQAYQKAIAEEENGEDIAEFITTRWLLKNSELYDFFESQLKNISTDFTTIEEIDLAKAQKIAKAASDEFGHQSAYLFSVLNSVVFPAEVFHQLEKQAKDESQRKNQENVQQNEKQSLEAQRIAFERDVARLTDKYEKKLAGLQKKYLDDTEGLKKQISSLQRKLKGHA